MSRAADRAYAYIRGEILAGNLRPGAQLGEEALAERVGVSRTPIREALQRLEAEQLIRRNRSQRSFVASLSLDEIAESFALRGILEGHAAARAAERIDEEALAALAAHNVAVGGALGDPDVFLERNRLFHAGVLGAAGSQRLTGLLASIVEQPIVLSTARLYGREQQARSLAEHEELVLAFRHRDPDWARAVMTAHIRRAFHVYSAAMGGQAAPDEEA